MLTSGDQTPACRMGKSEGRVVFYEVCLSFVLVTLRRPSRLYRLRPEPLQELDAWIQPFRRFWSPHLDALERHLDRMEQSDQARKKRSRTMKPNRSRRKGETK